MKKFMIFYKGPPTLPDASHEGWPDWFGKAGDQLVDRGSPLQNGLVLHKDGSTSGLATNFNGYSIIQAEHLDVALRLIKDHPFLILGTEEFAIEVFELQR